MTTIRFSKAEFESVLPTDSETGEKLWESVGFIKGEEVYQIKVLPTVYVEVRSSIGADGYAKESGGDSIRSSLLYKKKGTHPQPLGKATWTQRTDGWDKRLKAKLRELYAEAFGTKTCNLCGSMMALRKGKHGDFYGCTNYPRCKNTESLKTQKATPKTPEPTETLTIDELAEEIDDLSAILAEVEEPDKDELDLILEEEEAEAPPEVKTPNVQQLAYIEAPPDADIRVLAAPGSGKTLATVLRILHLINSGVKPSAIVYVTYTKAMATEGLERILAQMPEIENTALKSQICTIHAFCYRILRAEGDKRRLAETWRIKQIIEELVSGSKNTIGEFSRFDEKPGWKEIYKWLCMPKMLGVPEREVGNFYRGSLDFTLALKTERIYFKFNQRLNNLGYVTFADMLYDVEQKLLNDQQFRLRMQTKYTHILVDEAQDVNQQALRILMTIAKGV